MLRERYEEVARCPTWPMDRRVRRRFRIRDLVLPLQFKLVDLDALWSDVAGALGRVLGDE